MSHIMVWRGELPEDGLKGFWHHGILCDDGSVIHYSGMDGMKTLKNAHIKRTVMNEFLPEEQKTERTIHTINYDKNEHDTIYSREEIIKRAESRIGEGGYNLLSHNCENFARWCAIGDSKSYQVQGAFIGLGGALSTFLFGSGLLGAVLTGIVVQRVWDSAKNDSKSRVPFNSDNYGHNESHISYNENENSNGGSSSNNNSDDPKKDHN